MKATRGLLAGVALALSACVHVQQASEASTIPDGQALPVVGQGDFLCLSTDDLEKSFSDAIAGDPRGSRALYEHFHTWQGQSRTCALLGHSRGRTM